MRAVAVRSPMVVPAFVWAMTGAWPHATNVDQSLDQSLEQGMDQAAAAQLEVQSQLDTNAVFDMDLAATEVFEATSLARAPALSVALFTGEAETLFPVNVHVQVRDDGGELVLDEQVQAVDGQAVSIDEVVQTPQGERIFRIQAVARHHIGDVIELDWELEVHEAPFAGLDWESYLLHRFNLGPRPGVEAPHLQLARADIVEVAQAPFVERFSLDEADYELVLAASDERG